MSKFLTFDERLAIQAGLSNHKSFGEIGKDISKDRTTVAKEVKRYSFEQKSGAAGYCFNACIHRKTCKVKGLCGKECVSPSKPKCSLCNKCNDHCPNFQEEICRVTLKPPYVCNGCGDYRKCTFLRHIYDAETAHIRFSEHISESRTGILSSEDDISRINGIISPLVKNGQSIHQIYIDHVDELMCSEKTLYNYVDTCLFDVRNIDFPRKVKYRPRYKKPEFKVDRACRSGRSYDDFKQFMTDRPDTSVVQMDSVIGSVGGKVLLTIHFVESSFMLAFLRPANTSQSVIDVFNHLDKTLEPGVFEALFPVVLTDNGSEFSNPKALELREDWLYRRVQLRRTYIFYCDPSSPYQKGSIEVNHELIRRILPKGSSFDNLTQGDINKMMDHINSYKRKKLNNRSPYEVFSFLHGEAVLKDLNCHQIPAEDVVLKPRLLKK